MLQNISLEEAERKAFRTSINDGLWDIFLGCFFLIFVIAPFLSSRLGDFWSSAIFVPFWGLAYFCIWLTRKHVVIPRIGVVDFGRARKSKLKKFSLVMLSLNILAFVVGIVAAFSLLKVSGQAYSFIIGMALLIGFSLAAYFLEFNRLYVYGLLVGLSPFVGEWLWNHGYASHHGFPVTFGTASGVMIIVGLTVFIRLLRNNPVPGDEIPFEKA